MKKHGFTLVELLGIMVAIGIMAVITGPFVIRAINKSKKNAFKSSAEGIIRAITDEQASNNYNAKSYTITEGKIKDSEGNTLKTAGGDKETGSAYIDENGRVSIAVQSSDKKMCAIKELKESGIKVIDYKENICKIENRYKKYKDGTAIYYNPNTNKKCTEEEAKSETETKSGCMKWYIFLDDASSENVKVILDHNTSGNVAWNASGNSTEGMKEVKTRLEEDTSDWKVDGRLITADEVAKITGADKALQWSSDKRYNLPTTIGTNIAWFSLDGSRGTDPLWQTQIANEFNRSPYAWLYDNTWDCQSSGCDKEDNNKYTYGNTTNTENIKGYWTSTPVSHSSLFAWFIFRKGSLSGAYQVNDMWSFGVRPVITISKNIIS